MRYMGRAAGLMLCAGLLVCLSAVATCAAPAGMTTRTLAPRLAAGRTTAALAAAAMRTTATRRTSATLAAAAAARATSPTAMYNMPQLDMRLRPPGAPRDTSATLVVLYNGARHSSVDPCRCIAHKLGGIDREARVTSRVAEWGMPVLHVDAGGFCREMPGARDVTMMHAMMGALKTMGCDAVNVGLPDLQLSRSFFEEAQKQWSTPFVSANLVDDAGAAVFAPYRVVERTLKCGTTVRVGIIGVTRSNQTTGSSVRTADRALRVLDPAAALEKHLPKLRAESDFIVLLTYQTREDAAAMLKRLGPQSGIAMAVSSEMTVGQSASYYRDNMRDAGGIRLFSAWMEGRYSGVAMVSGPGSGAVAYANRLIEIEQAIPPLPEVTKLLDDYKKATLRPQGTPSVGRAAE